jgi:glycosyltransferase involved in cell wall biosynthesis
MHILIIHQAFAALDEAGGTRHHELARYLVNRGHRVTIIASPVSYLTGKTRSGRSKWVERQEVQPGITILRSYTYPAFHKSFVHRVFGFFSFMVSSFIVGLSVPQVDLVWGTSPPIFQAVTAWLIARLKRVPFLFEVRDLWPAFAIAVGVLRNPLLVRATLWLERFLYQRADRVMVNSPGFIEHVRRRGARWIELVPNGADPEMFNPDDCGLAFRTRYHLEDRFVILYAGAHGMSNDLGMALEAAGQLRGSQICFVFVGDGKEKASLQAQAAAMQLDNVLFLPAVPKDEISQVMSAADACLAILKPLELYKTTYPNKVFDYMAAGRPVLLAIDGVIRQVVEAADAGLAVPPGNAAALAQAAAQLASDPQRARAMGSAGRSYIVRHFSREILAEKLALLLEDMRGVNG